MLQSAAVGGSVVGVVGSLEMRVGILLVALLFAVSLSAVDAKGSSGGSGGGYSTTALATVNAKSVRFFVGFVALMCMHTSQKACSTILVRRPRPLCLFPFLLSSSYPGPRFLRHFTLFFFTFVKSHNFCAMSLLS